MHVCEETIRKRLDEFKDTKTAQLKRGEFKELEANSKDPHEFAYESFGPPEISKGPIRDALGISNEKAESIEK